MRVSLEKQQSKEEVDDDLFSKFSDLPKGSEVNKQISDLIKAQEKERADRLTEDIKDTIKDAIHRNIPAVGFIGEHYDFLSWKLLDFQRLFEHLGYKVWKTYSKATSELMVYVIFDLEHFGLKDEYLRDESKGKLQELIGDETTNSNGPVFSPKKKWLIPSPY